jgi:hypothetical protein
VKREANRWMSTILAVLVVSLAIPSVASARMLRHYDLRSLFLLSQRVIRGQKVSMRTTGGSGRATTFRVLHSYEGDLQKGDTVEIGGPSSYAFAGMGEASASQPVPEQLVLFLTRVSNPQPGAPAWHITTSGVRMIRDGKAFRFEQHSNPGPFVPVPHRRDPFDLLGLPGAGEQLTESQLHEDLERAKTAALAVERALLIADPAKARTALLALVGPPLDERKHAAVVNMWSNFVDITAARILRRLARLDDLDGVLEAWTRVRGRKPPVSWPGAMTADRFLAAAEDGQRSVRHRVAALQVVDRMRSHDEATVERLSKLLADPEAVVRAEVVASFDMLDPDGVVTPALVALWHTEEDHRVQHALLRAAHRLDRVSDFRLAGRPEVVVTARREQDVVDVEYVTIRDEAWHLDRVVVSLKQGGKDVRTIELVGGAARPGVWGSAHFGGARVRMAPAPPLAPGTYDASVEIAVGAAEGKKHERKLSLEPWVIAAPPKPPAPEPPPPPAPAPAIEVMSQFPSKRGGCACRLGGPPVSSPWWALLPVALGLLQRRRSTMRRASGAPLGPGKDEASSETSSKVSPTSSVSSRAG